MNCNGRHDFTICQGATLIKTFAFRQEDQTTPIDLTGYTARMQAREYVESDTVLIELTTENGGISINGPLGTVTLNLSATDTAAIEWDVARYDLELIDGATVYRPLTGKLKVSPEVTR